MQRRPGGARPIAGCLRKFRLVVARGETGVDHQVDHYERQEAMLIRIARGSWRKVMPDALIRVVARGETGVDHHADHYERQEARPNSTE